MGPAGRGSPVIFRFICGGVDNFSRRFEIATKRRLLKEQAVSYKGGKCRICGYNRTIAAMEFHHPDALEKDFTIAARMVSWTAIVRELDKCILLCANCHREVHDGMHPGYLEDPDAGRGEIDGDLWGDPVDLDEVAPVSQA